MKIIEIFKLFGSVFIKDEASSELGKIEQKADGTASKFTTMGETFGKVGAKATEVGKSLTAKVTAPIVGMGVVAVKSAMDFEKGMSNVSALSGATGTDLKKLEDVARELGGSTVFSAKEASEGLEYLALAGWSVDQMASGLEPTLKLAGAAGMELGEAADIVTDTMSMFGMEAHEATKMTDMLAYAQANSNTDVLSLGEALKYAGAGANAMGYDLADTAAILGTFADQGLKGSAAGTTLNAMFTDMKKNSKDGAIAIGDHSVAIVDANGNYRDMADIMSDVELATKDMTQAEKDQALSAIFGTQAIKGMNMILEAGTDTLKNFEDGIRNSDGAASNMYDTMNDNLAGSFENLKSALGETAISMGTLLIPYLQQGVEWITKMVDKFNGLDDSTKKVIIVILGIVAAIGPLLLIFGTVATKISAIITLVTTVTGAITAAGGAATVFGGIMAVVTGPIGLAVAAIAAIGIGAVALAKHLGQDAIPAVELFGAGISEATAEAVGSFLELEEQATLALNQLNWSGQEVTQEMSNTIVESFEGMKNQVVEKLNEQKEESLSTLKQMADESTTMSEQEKADMIRITGEKYDEQAKKVEEGNAKVKQIMEKATSEKRSLTEEEKTEINKIKESMKEDAVRILSESEAEQMAIMENLKSESGKISALQAAEVVKNSKKQKDETVKEAEEEYKKRLKAAAELRADGTKESAKMADDIVKEAKRQRDDSVKQAEGMHKDVVKEAKAQAKDHVKEVDWETGEIKSKWEVMKSKVSETASNIKNDVKKEWNETKAHNKQVWNDIKTSVSETWNNMKTSVSSKASEIKSAISNKWNEVKSATTQKWNEIKEAMIRPVESAKSKISEIINEVKGFFSNLRLKFPKIEMPALPRFSLNGSFSLNPPSVPSLSVDWFAKGGIMTSPMAFGMNGNNIMAGGEAGHEAILPLNPKTLGGIGRGIADTMQDSHTTQHIENIFNISQLVVREEADIKKIAQELYNMQQRSNRGRGLSV